MNPTSIVTPTLVDQIVQYGLPSALLLVFIIISVYLVNNIKTIFQNQIKMLESQQNFTNNNIVTTLQEVTTLVKALKESLEGLKTTILDVKTTISNYDLSIKYSFQEIEANVQKYFLDIERKTESLAKVLSNLNSDTIEEIVENSQETIKEQIDRMITLINSVLDDIKCKEEVMTYLLTVAKKEKIEKIYTGIRKIYNIVNKDKLHG